ncbi:MAG: PQQ-like beta-propeller repeat protein [Anaerolineales bacterium]|nr:PQQ-like beta-propeller repeat protein [Anaerolineales bacterium]
MNIRKAIPILLLAFGSLALSACSGRAGIVNTWAGLSADGERAYLASGSHVYAADAQTGKEVWRYPAETDNNLIFFANPAISDDGQLIIGSEGNNHKLVSLDPQTGKENWANPFTAAKGKWVAAPLIYDGTIYAPNSDGYLYFLDLKGVPVADPIKLGGSLWSTPATDGTHLYVASLDHNLHIVDIASKKSVGVVDLGGAATSSPVVGEGGVYVGSFSANVEEILPNGDHKILATASNWIWGTPALENGVLYYADIGGSLYALDLASGKQLWSDVKPDGAVVANPLVADGAIYFVTESGTILALDSDASTRWSKESGGKIYTTPVLSNGTILVAPYQADFALAAYDADGKQIWTFAPAK